MGRLTSLRMVYMWSIAFLISFLYVSNSLALFPGREPEQGDVRHIYPSMTIGLGLDDHAHILPYLLGWLENLDYPKSRIHLEIYLLGREDSTPDQIHWWHDSLQKGLFSSVTVHEEGEDPKRIWEEHALRSARLRSSARFLLITGDVMVTDLSILRKLLKSTEEPVVVVELQTWPTLPGRASSIAHSISPPLYMNLSMLDASYLTFDEGNLPVMEGETFSRSEPWEVFAESIKRLQVKTRKEEEKIGYFFDPTVSLAQRREMIRYLVADQIAEYGHAWITSRSVRPYFEEPSTLGTDAVFLINLRRRPERLSKMRLILQELAVKFELWPATDGQADEGEADAVPKDFPIGLDDRKRAPMKLLPGYLDPFHKRPIKAGEIGCAISHYRIWQEVLKRGLKRVLVLEDDIRFLENGTSLIQETLEDLDKLKTDWDLVYVGRKKQDEKADERWVTGHRHLSTVAYSYWTLGYLLSAQGAQKLLQADYPHKLLPVDEFLPIMYNSHPNKEWSEHFVTRNLKAFTIYPLAIVPQRYTNQEGYVSDTEASEIVGAEDYDEHHQEPWEDQGEEDHADIEHTEL